MEEFGHGPLYNYCGLLFTPGIEQAFDLESKWNYYVDSMDFSKYIGMIYSVHVGRASCDSCELTRSHGW